MILINIGIPILKLAVKKKKHISFKNFESSFFFSLVNRLNYSEACSLDSDCNPTLICPSMPGYCNCPTYLPDYVCNCANTKYYNSSISQCGKRTSNYLNSKFLFFLIKIS